jgi:AraC family ethanolamine operon transcriptional activator
LEETFQVDDVCLALHVSRRELEYAFRSILDQSPKAHLQTLRLNAIRRAMLHVEQGEVSVIDIAQSHGMTHLGRFAAHYRTLFGESPSSTLRRRARA